MIDDRMKIAAADRSDSDWWQVDREILECLSEHEAMSVSEIARRLDLSEGEATSLLAMLAREGRVRICQVMLAA
jgi:DNA-binding Lrp family transcriptional regulator